MANAIWTGQAASVAQVDTITIGGTIAVSETFAITINNKSVSYTTDADDVAADVAEALHSLCAASTVPEFTEIDWTVESAVITGTSATDGVPFEVSVSTDSAAGTITQDTVTDAASPNHWDAAGNWSTGAIPQAGDSVFITDPDAEIIYGLPAGSILFAEVQIRAGILGLPRQNPAGYPEYRAIRAVFGATLFTVGSQNTGPSLVRVNLGTDSSTITILGALGSQLGASIDLLLNNASSTVSVLGGTVDIAAYPGETSTVATVNVGPSGNVTIGEDVTVTTVTSAGTLSIISAATTVNVEAGQANLSGSGDITTVQIRGGVFNHRGSGTITTAGVGPGVLDFSGDVREKTVTNCTIRKDGVIQDPFNAATFTNGVSLDATADRMTAQ